MLGVSCWPPEVASNDHGTWNIKDPQRGHTQLPRASSYQRQPIGSSKSTGESMTQWWTWSKIFPPNWSKQRKNTCPWTWQEPWAHETPLGSFVLFLWYPWILSAGLALCSCLSGIIFKTIQREYFLGNSNPMSKSISIEINPFQSSEKFHLNPLKSRYFHPIPEGKRPSFHQGTANCCPQRCACVAKVPRLRATDSNTWEAMVADGEKKTSFISMISPW